MKKPKIYIVENDEGIQEVYEGAFEDDIRPFDKEVFRKG